MELNNEFAVGVPLSQAWEVLTDLQRIAPCMPGAELREVEGDEYRGVVKVKVGPISAEYRGAARFAVKDEASHRAVLRAEGRESRGQGNANATITAILEPSGGTTTVTLTTDLQITGKVAQFGRGVLADVSNKLLGQFVENLEKTLLGGDGGQGTPGSRADEDTSKQARANASEEGSADFDGRQSTGGGSSGNGAVRRVQSSPAEPVDLLEVAGAPVARRVLPVVGAAFAVVVVFSLLRRLCRGRSRD